MSTRQSRLAALCRTHRVASLYAFGSRGSEALHFINDDLATLEAGASDLDLAVVPVGTVHLSARARVRLTLELEQLFDVARVDLILLPEAKPFLAVDVVRGELLYCDDLDRQAREELYFLRRAADLAHFQRERQDGILSGELRT